MKQNVIAGFGFVLFISALAFFAVSYAGNVFASAPSGLPATQTTATTTVVGPANVVTIFNSRTSCSSRIISTSDGSGTPIRLLFGDPTNGDLASTTLTNANGNFQAGSTTAAYDSGLYGCGRWTAKALASTTITVIEMN